MAVANPPTSDYIGQIDEILLSAEKGNWEVVKKKLDQHPLLVNFRPPHHKYAVLHYAAWWGNKDAVKYILKLPFTYANVKTQSGKTAVEIANARGHATVATLIQQAIETGVSRGKRLLVAPERPMTFAVERGEHFMLGSPLKLNFIQQCAGKYPTKHWVNVYMCGSPYTPLSALKADDWRVVQNMIAQGLQKQGYVSEAQTINLASSEDEMNVAVIHLYTGVTLYPVVNAMLRESHEYSCETYPITPEHENMAPYILQLDVALRFQRKWEDACYQGADITKKDLRLYTKGTMFVWTSFISASKSRHHCFGGNTIFELSCGNISSFEGKDYPRDISHLSEHPEEEEVLYPIGCCFIVTSHKIVNGIHVIQIATTDVNHILSCRPS